MVLREGGGGWMVLREGGGVDGFFKKKGCLMFLLREFLYLKIFCFIFKVTNLFFFFLGVPFVLLLLLQQQKRGP